MMFYNFLVATATLVLVLDAGVKLSSATSPRINSDQVVLLHMHEDGGILVHVEQDDRVSRTASTNVPPTPSEPAAGTTTSSTTSTNSVRKIHREEGEGKVSSSPLLDVFVEDDTASEPSPPSVEGSAPAVATSSSHDGADAGELQSGSSGGVVVDATVDTVEDAEVSAAFLEQLEGDLRLQDVEELPLPLLPPTTTRFPNAVAVRNPVLVSEELGGSGSVGDRNKQTTKKPNSVEQRTGDPIVRDRTTPSPTEPEDHEARETYGMLAKGILRISTFCERGTNC